jgi:hypothetical protein
MSCPRGRTSEPVTIEANRYIDPITPADTPVPQKTVTALNKDTEKPSPSMPWRSLAEWRLPIGFLSDVYLCLSHLLFCHPSPDLFGRLQHTYSGQSSPPLRQLSSIFPFGNLGLRDMNSHYFPCSRQSSFSSPPFYDGLRQGRAW